MERIKEQSSAGPVSSTRSKLRYPLRSATKPRDAVPEPLASSASKRARATSNVSKSVSVLDLSGKEKPAKPPRRLSVPAKSAMNPFPRHAGNVTPISETRLKKSANVYGKSDTPTSDASKSTGRRKFSVLSSASYWISQIKLSESTSKHSISLGFFKLALESGCEPLQRMHDELKSYAQKHNLLELGEPAKELLRTYNVLEELEQFQASDTFSRALESSDEDSQASSIGKEGSLKPKILLNSENIRRSGTNRAVKNVTAVKKSTVTKNRVSINKSSANAVTENRNSIQKRPQRSNREKIKKEMEQRKNEDMFAACEKDSTELLSTDSVQLEEKENMDGGPPMEEISWTGET